MVELNQVYLIDYGIPEDAELSESADMLKMFLNVCIYFDLDTLMIEKMKNVGPKIPEQKEQIINELISKNAINPIYARPLVEFFIDVFETYTSKRLPNYDKLYGILERALHLRGDQSQPIVFDWLTDEEKAAARKVPIIPIESIQFEIA